MDLDSYRNLRAQAGRLARDSAEADDLVQDTLLAALETGRSDDAWLHGVLRNQAAMAARGAVRRRGRERVAVDSSDDVIDPCDADDAPPDPKPLLARLPRAARKVLVLALNGLSADEIRWILQLTPAAFRQRLTSIRKVLATLPPSLREAAVALAQPRDPSRHDDLPVGLIRRSLIAALRGDDAMGTHDHDGHLLVIQSGAHGSPRRGNE